MAEQNALATLNPEVVKASLKASPGIISYLDLAPRQLLAAKTYTKIETEEEVQSANALLNWFKDGKRDIEKACKPITALMDSLHKAATGGRAEMLRDFEAGILHLDPRIKSYIREQEEEKRLLQEQLDRQAEAEKRRLEKEAEDLIRRGQVAQAEELERAIPTVLAPTLPSARTELSGSSYRGKFVAEVTDIVALAKAIVDGRVPLMHMYRGEARPLLLVNDMVLQSLASTQGKSLNLPGVKVDEDFSLSRRRGV